MTDIVKDAENFVKEKFINHTPKGDKIDFTTSQIRKFLSSVNRIENRVMAESETLSDDIANEIRYLKIMLAYQTGRAEKAKKETRAFYNELIPKIDKIGNSKKAFTEFARYVEAIVAYHKFYGGKD